jgi:hypothetical protein
MSPLHARQIQAETFPDGVALRCRYLRVQQTLDQYPFKRAKLYEYLARGDIKSFVLKERGALRGIRLIDRDSIDSWLEAAAQSAAEKV